MSIKSRHNTFSPAVFQPNRNAKGMDGNYGQGSSAPNGVVTHDGKFHAVTKQNDQDPNAPMASVLATARQHAERTQQPVWLASSLPGAAPAMHSKLVPAKRRAPPTDG